MHLVSGSRASIVATIRSVRFSVVFCIVRIQYAFSFAMVLALFEDWLEVTM